MSQTITSGRNMEQHVSHATEVLTDPRLLSVPAGAVGMDFLHISVPDFIMYGTAVLIALQLVSWLWKGIKAIRRVTAKHRRVDD